MDTHFYVSMTQSLNKFVFFAAILCQFPCSWP